MSELSIDGAMAKLGACKQQQAVSGNFEAAGALCLAEIVIQLLKAEVSRLLPPPPAEPTEAK